MEAVAKVVAVIATQLFFLNSAFPPDTHLGTDNANLRSTNVAWYPNALATSRGGSATTTQSSTVTGPTPGVELPAAAGVIAGEWISPPVAADVTISGTITANLWASENSMTANVAINVVIEIIRANATATRNSNTLVEIVRSTNATELGTSRVAVNFTSGMTSGGYTGQTLNRGDRLRIRVFGDDGGGSMATGFTFNFAFSGASAAADGDSYVTFTENITFENPPGFATLDQPNSGGGSAAAFGSGTSDQLIAQSFVAQGTTLTQVKGWLRKQSSPTDNVVVEIRTDSGGVPSSTVVGTVATVAGSGLTSAVVQLTWTTSIALTVSQTYWLVYSRSGANDAVNFYGSDRAFNASWTTAKRWNGGAWPDLSSVSLTVYLAFTGAGSLSTVYLTDTVSAVATASVDKEAWTSRGSGVTSIVTNTSAGWTAPVQATATAGGTVVDWFTRPLTAFTLTGMAVLNIRALESNAAANASLRCEIARVEGDGTSPTVWSSWCCAPTGTDNGELTTSEVARTINLSGDDLAITDGQRLRIRLYNEDISSAAMVTGHTVTRYYNGTSDGASGDTYITFPMTLTEYVSGVHTTDSATVMVLITPSGEELYEEPAEVYAVMPPMII